MVVLAYEEETQRAPPPAQPTYDFAERCRLPGSSDNAAIAKDDVPAKHGHPLQFHNFAAAAYILEGHRFALVPIAEGELITSWGEPFGRALRAIAAGEWLRNANTLRVLRGRPQIADGVLDGDAAQLCQLHEAATGAHRGRLRARPAAAAPRGARGARLRRLCARRRPRRPARAIARCCSASRRARASSRARSSGGWRRRRAARSTASSRSRTPRTAASPPMARRRRRTVRHTISSARCSGCSSIPTSAPPS